ncbi:MAG: hypothetical protein ACE5MH_11280 [Terriglobia bacterium]
MFGKIYNIAVAVCAVGLLLLVVFGALFAVTHGLASHFMSIDLWGRVAATLAPLFEALAGFAETAWSFVEEQAQAAWDLAQGWLAGPEKPAPAPK